VPSSRARSKERGTFPGHPALKKCSSQQQES